MKKPELLAPAGNLEKLHIAFQYGADAVYLAGTQFGLRKYAENFSLDELNQGVSLANELNKKVYVVLNGFSHEQDMKELPHYLNALENIQAHGLIISDLGILSFAKKRTQIPLHISTQASVTNWRACKFFKEQGAKRIILAREVSVQECEAIK